MAISTSATTKLLFIGDSITDAGQQNDPERVGNGYVRLIRDYLRAVDPATAPQIINHGISGNRVTDLELRWERDVIQIAPDVLSIKIGINDVWHGLAGGTRGVDLDRFMLVYDQLLTLTAAVLPKCQLVLCEPSVIWPPQPIDGNEKLHQYVLAVRGLARKHNAEALVPLHDAFEAAKRARPEIEWTADGVHPNSTGHMLIARTWLQATGLL